jgi:hypothetical protein
MNLTNIDFASSFGEEVNELDESVLDLIEQEDLALYPLSTMDRDLLLIEVIERIRKDKQVIASEDRTAAWEKGWAENLEMFRQNPNSDAALVPKFVREGLPVRWFKKYFNSNVTNFELKYIEILRQFIITKYFGKVDNLYEFGAGTGFNLLHANRIYPNLTLIGTDFVQPAVDLMNLIGKERAIPLRGSIFNMLTPQLEDLRLQSNSAVWTFGSLEQLGGQVAPMIDYLIENGPAICVHVEPVVEFYEDGSIEDYLAKWFQTKRGYTAGLVKLLAEYEESGKIEILKSHRLNFGSVMMEGYNLVVWRPTP